MLPKVPTSRFCSLLFLALILVHGKVSAQTNCAPPPSGLVSWWRSESNALDQVSGNNGSLVGNATYAPGEVGTGFTLNGAGDAVQIGNPPALQLQNFTVEGWIQRASTNVATQNAPNNALLFGCSWGGYGVGLWNDGRLLLTKIGYSSISSTNTITDLNFHHVAVAKSGSTIQFYIDGVGETTGPYDPGFVFNGPSAIGARGTDFVGGFFGDIDEISVYSRGLSAAEIQTIYNARTSGKCLTPIPPFFISQPVGQSIPVGANLTLNALAAGSSPLSYQWQLNGANLLNATNSSLTLTNATVGQSGNYAVLVTNLAGSILSTNALATVIPPPASVYVASTNSASGAIATLPIVIDANGNENALGFSIAFDQTSLIYTGAVAGLTGANLTANTSLVGSGKLGLTFSLPPGATLSAGTQQIAFVRFATTVVTNNAKVVSISFGDQPTPRQLLDGQLNTLPATYTNGNLTINPTVGQTTCAPPPSGLVSWWRGESNALDQVGGNNGSLVGNTTYAPGEVGTGFAFNGAGDAVQIGNPPNLQLQNFTIEGWIQRASTSVTSQNDPNNGAVFCCAFGGYGVTLWNDGRLSLTKVGLSNVSSTNAITDLNFHHVAVAKSGATIQFYIDGVGETTGPYDPGFVFNGPSAIGARGDGFGSGFFGAIDEISVYSRGLSAAEIQTIYNAGISGKCLTPISPFLISQPVGQSIPVGANLTLNALAAGSSPLSYQWQLNGANLLNATNSSLTLTNATVGQSGNYAVLVTNLAGSILSTNALVTVIPPPASVYVASTNSASGAIATLPIVIDANGNENALGFSIAFDQTSLIYTGAVAGLTGANLTANTSLVGSGKLGLTFSLPPGRTLSPGTQQIALVSFATPVVTNSAKVVSISFGDQPTPRQLLDGQLNTLTATYNSGNLTINPVTALEGDVFPRPNGDLAVGLDDWLQMARFVARLEYPTNASEFQRADCAPRATSGDGAIRISDWVQVGRYMAGLDPLTRAAGPTNEIAVTGPGTSTNRLLSASTVALGPAQPFRVSITLSAQGNENAAGFSVSFDPALATFASGSLGSDAIGATLYLNTNQVSSGNLGFALALGTGSSFSQGSKELVRLTFQSSASASGSFSVSFADQPVPREISDPTAIALPAGYVNALVTIYPPPSLTIAQLGTNVTLGWPLWATNFSLQEAKGGLPPYVFWSNVPSAPELTNNQNLLTLPLGLGPNFYRLSK